VSDATADTEAAIRCPYCGKRVEIGLDPGSGPKQEYVEDCEVCCRSVVVSVRYAQDGKAVVTTRREDEV
jgi:hypothetical protein